MNLPTSKNAMGLIALALFLMPCVSLSATKRPNVVVLLADDLGWKDIGCYDGPVKTPTLDRLAAEGVRFTDFHSGCGVCSPSRATTLTGRHHIRAGVYHVIDDYSHAAHLLEREVTLAEVLKSHGYATAHVGKWHLGLPVGRRQKPTPVEHGFDYWFATVDNANPSHKDPINFIRNGTPVGRLEGYSCQLVVDEAISWLERQRDPDAPFFLNVWFHEPHAPTAAPNEIVSQYGDLKDPAAIYSGTIENTDRAIARLLAKIKEIDSLENTLIVYASDNGSYRKERNGSLRADKGSNFEGGIRVPGIFYWSGTIQAGHVEHEPAGLVDLLPTVCGLAGIDKPEGVHLDGSDLTPLLKGRRKEFERHQPLFFMLPTSNPAATVREGQFALVAYRAYELPIDYAAMRKLMAQAEEILRKEDSSVLRDGDLWSKMFNSKFDNREAERLRIQFVRLMQFHESWIPAIKTGGYGRFELYDLEVDLGQKKDVSKHHPEIVARLKQQLLDINASVIADAPDWHSISEVGISERPNVLFLAVDDLNDWVGCLGGHPQAKTPNIDRLARKGVLFEQAYCAAPLCSPSRTAILTGLRPSTTGIYGNLAWFRDIPRYKDWVTIPQYFRQHGYTAVTGGKIYHQAQGKFSDPVAWDRQYSTQTGTPFAPEANRYRHGMHDLFSNKILARLIDWGPIEQPTEQTNDWRTADKAAQLLHHDHDKPFFLACGIYHPHLPWYVPQEYFDMHPLESIELPAWRENDLDDIPPVGRRMAGEALSIIKEHGHWKNAVQGRLASGSFADACVGHVLDALENSQYRDNTIVVLWGDHGYDIGQKKFAKSALWEQTTRTPLIIHAPGISKSGGRCRRPVSLVDLYPTLIDLCALPNREDLDGRSLAPLVRRPESDWPHPAIITHSPHWHGTNHAIRSERYHYIHYSDGGEELYDMSNDPNQWDNLADHAAFSEVKKQLSRWLPNENADHFQPKTVNQR